MVPLYTVEFDRKVYVLPPSVLNCHCKVEAPAAVMLKDVFAPAHIAWFAGCAEIAGPVPGLIVKVIFLVCVVAPVAFPVMVIV